MCQVKAGTFCDKVLDILDQMEKEDMQRMSGTGLDTDEKEQKYQEKTGEKAESEA